MSLKACASVAVVFALSAPACTRGPMHIRERYYLAAPGYDNTNYYRVTVKGDTELAATQFRQGWFPGAAVDAVFGDTESSEGEAQANEAREKMRKQIDASIVEAQKKYL